MGETRFAHFCPQSHNAFSQALRRVRVRAKSLVLELAWC